MLKPILEHYKSLPDDVRERAIANRSEFPLGIFKETGSLKGAISSGFDWHQTPEGYDYWREVFMSLQDTESTACTPEVDASIPLSDLATYIRTNTDRNGKVDAEGLRKEFGL